MVDVKMLGLLAAILAMVPPSARAQTAAEPKADVAAQIKEAERLTERANSAMKAGHYAEAEGPLRTALLIREAAQGRDHLDTAKAVNNLALACMKLGKREEAKALYRRSLAIREKALGPDHPEVARGLCRLALAYAATGDREEKEQAVDLARRGVAIQEKALGPDHPDVADSWDDLASILFLKARHDGLTRKRWFPALSSRPATGPGSREEALDAIERDMKRAIAVREKAQGPDEPGLATPLNNLGVLYAEEGRYAEAAPVLKRAVALREKAKGPDDPRLASDLGQYAAILGRARKDPEAKAEVKSLNARAQAIRDAQVQRASADSPRER
jgi:tetratricopeptide (TPR) repeat protein